MPVRPQWRLQDRITRARVEAGMKTQAELAAALHVDSRTVSRWEAGLHMPRHRDLVLIAQVTGVDLEWLVGEAGEAGVPLSTSQLVGSDAWKSSIHPGQGRLPIPTVAA